MRGKSAQGDTGDRVLTLDGTLDLSGTTAPEFSYWTLYALGVGQTVSVDVSTDGGATWDDPPLQTTTNATTGIIWARVHPREM